MGRAVGLVTRLLATAGAARKDREVLLPMQTLDAHGVAARDVLAGADPAGELSDGVRAAVFDVASRAKEQLATARDLSGDVSEGARGLLLPALAADVVLERLENAQFDPFSPSLLAPSLRADWRLWRAARRGEW